MVRRQAVVVVVPISGTMIWLLHALMPGAAFAQDDSGARIEHVAARMAFFEQTGHGYQSQDGPVGGPGSESLLVFQPIGQIRIAQGDDVTHTVTLPIDIVSSASADALDATSSASRDNEAVAFAYDTRVRVGPAWVWSLRSGLHFEEPFWSANAGVGVTHSFAENNATLAVSADAILDMFDRLDYEGYDNGELSRFTGAANVSLSQLLSESTLVSGAYGLTWQGGTLEVPYNSVPLTDGTRSGEVFPTHRIRHALRAEIAQNIVPTRTTVRLGYRFYVDSFDLFAHTASAQVYQYIGTRLLTRASYRFHVQFGVDFFREAFEPQTVQHGPRTADSDLAPFHAHEAGFMLRYYFDPILPLDTDSSYIEASFTRYMRSNDLDVNILALAYGQRL